MNIDPDGRFFFTLLITSFILGAVIGGGIGGFRAHNAGQTGWGLFGGILGGAILGGAMGAAFAFGAGAGLASLKIGGLALTIGGKTIGTGAAFGIATGIGIAGGLGSFSVESHFRTDMTWNTRDFITSGISGGLQAMANFGVGFAAGRFGGFDSVIIRHIAGRGAVDSFTRYGAQAIIHAARPSILRPIVMEVTWQLGAPLARAALFSSTGVGIRLVIDRIVRRIFGR